MGSGLRTNWILASLVRYLRIYLKVGGEERLGWYLQQFHKLQASRQSTAGLSIIWDSDCVPLNLIELFDKDGRALYMEADEFNSHYLTLVDRWLGLKKA